jgi:hypothetical protein
MYIIYVYYIYYMFIPILLIIEALLFPIVISMVSIEESMDRIILYKVVIRDIRLIGGYIDS